MCFAVDGNGALWLEGFFWSTAQFVVFTVIEAK